VLNATLSRAKRSAISYKTQAYLLHFTTITS